MEVNKRKQPECKVRSMFCIIKILFTGGKEEHNDILYVIMTLLHKLI